MKKVIISGILLLATGVTFGQANIADARTYSIGQTVTVSGVVTNGSELGNIRYMQDNTAGIAAFGSSVSGVLRGDSITVTGAISEFSGLLEISPISGVVNHGQAVNPPSPLGITIPAAGESLESQLVQLDNVTFVQTGNFATGNSTVQVTDGTNTFDVRINGSTVIDGTAIPTGPVTVVGEMGQFNTNYQIVPRDLNDIFPYVAPATEINVLLNGNTVFSGSNYFVGAAGTVNVTIENFGSSALTITGASFSGANAGDFSTTIAAGTVAGSGQQAYTITFAPTGTGSRFATISIGNDDADENPYIINFEGVGTDNLATEPTSNAASLTFPTVEAYTLGGQCTPGTGATNYLVIWKNGSAITGAPVDGTTYLRGDVVGDARVAYSGPATSFTPRGIIANQNYYFAVYAFNGQGGYENYLTTSPATANVSSTGSNIGTYYNGIDKNAGTFITDLYNLINPHTSVTYFMYKQTMMNEFEVRDTTGGQSFVECVYSGDRRVFNDPFDWTPTGFSREHTFAHSWMPSYPADNPELPEYNDQHHLWPALLDEANTPRSNLPLDDVTGSTVFSYMEGTVGYNGSQLVYEPRASQKGNSARSLMYMVVAYGFPLTGNINSDKQKQETMKAWHFADLPDNYEIARHEYIYDLQGNRNPFIDSVDFACYVDFDANTHVPNGCTASITEEQLVNNFVVFPVPSDNKVYVQINGTEIVSYEVIDMQGRVVKAENDSNLPVLILNAQDFKAGSYIIKVNTVYGSAQKKMIIE